MEAKFHCCFSFLTIYQKQVIIKTDFSWSNSHAYILDRNFKIEQRTKTQVTRVNEKFDKVIKFFVDFDQFQIN